MRLHVWCFALQDATVAPASLTACQNWWLLIQQAHHLILCGVGLNYGNNKMVGPRLTQRGIFGTCMILIDKPVFCFHHAGWGTALQNIAWSLVQWVRIWRGWQEHLQARGFGTCLTHWILDHNNYPTCWKHAANMEQPQNHGFPKDCLCTSTQ